MKRKQLRRLLEKVESSILTAVQAGQGKKKEHVKIVRMQLQNDPSLTLLDLYIWVASVLCSQAKQRLRREGTIEIGSQGVTKLSRNLDSQDLMEINHRRRSHGIGLFINQAKWCHEKGMIDECREYLAMIRVLSPEAAQQLEEQLLG